MEVALMAGIVTLIFCLLWWWNDIKYTLPALLRCSAGGTKLPLGNMGVPFLGELLTFLWYFKFLRRPDEYINSKRQKFGDGEGLYRSYLFGSPVIIAYTPSANKFVLQSKEHFFLEWPSVKLMGTTSLVAVQGNKHMRLKSFVVKAINQPDSLRRIALVVQPRIIDALENWNRKGRINVYSEVKKVTFENIGNYFASIEPSPLLDTIAELFEGLVPGFRANPINFPGTAYHKAFKCRKKLNDIFREEWKRRKKSHSKDVKNDLMKGLMQMKDEGKNLLDDEVLDNIVSLIVGGYEPTTLAIMWSVYYLAKYPNLLKKLREEHTSIKKSGDLITYDEILTCKYTAKVVDETIRLANIAMFSFRTANKDVEFKGYTIPKGWKVICWLRYLHTNPENFEDPMCFNPDRWNELPNPEANLVFGRGNRTCAGNLLVRLQISIVIHHLAIGYGWELVNPDAKMLALPHLKPEDGVEIDILKL